MQLEHFIKVKPEQDRIILMYLFENTIRSKIIRDSEVLEGKTEDEVRPGARKAGEKSNSRKDNRPSIEGEQLDYWYQNYFFAYGIESTQKELPGASRVYFINKISYQ